MMLRLQFNNRVALSSCNRPSYRVFENIEIATLHHKSISDSIFMSSANDAYNFLCATKQVFLSFLENGLFVRGGIAYNKHFETNHITYSLALTDAYLSLIHI